MPTGTIRYVNYKKITALNPLGETWEVYPYDYDGKPIPFMLIEVDSNVGQVDIQLINIVGTTNNKPYNLTGTNITIVALNGLVNEVTVSTIGSDTIGSLADIKLDSNGSNAILTPANNNDWSATISDGASGAGQIITLNTYNELYQLIDNQQLIPLAWYRFPYQSVNFLNGWDNANNNTPGIFPSYDAREISTGDGETLLVQAISTYEIAEIAYSEQYPGDIIQYAPYTNQIGVIFDATNGQILPDSTVVSNFDLQYDGTNVYFEMPKNYPALFGHYFYLYCEFDDGINPAYYQNGVYEPLTPVIAQCQFPYTSGNPFYNSPKAMSRIEVSENGYKIILLDLDKQDYLNYIPNTLYVETIYAIGDSNGYITRRTDTFRNITTPFDFRGFKYRRYEVETLGLIKLISNNSTGNTATDGTYYNVVGSNITGVGQGATFKITVFGGSVVDVRIMDQGRFYANGNTIQINGTSIGGVAGDNFQITIVSVNSSIGFFSIGTNFQTLINVPADKYEDFNVFNYPEAFNINWNGIGGPDSYSYAGLSENNIFYGYTHDLKIEDNFKNNSFSDETSNNSFEGLCSNNCIFRMQNSSVKNNFTSNAIFLMDYVNVKNNFFKNEISDGFAINNIESGFSFNRISTNFSANNIGDTFINNRVLEFFVRNNIGSQFEQNYIGNYAQNNSIENNFSTNYITDYFAYNTIKSDFVNNRINDGFGYGGFTQQGNTIGSNFNSNIIGEYFYNNHIVDNFINNTIANNFQLNNVRVGITGLSFLASTFVYGNYNCDIILASDANIYLAYFDGTNTQYVFPTL